MLTPLFFHIISDAPIVSVHLANEEPVPNRVIIRAERENVTLKCRANANPSAESFGWFKNVSWGDDRQPKATSMQTRHRLMMNLHIHFVRFIYLYLFRFFLVFVCFVHDSQGMRMSGENTETLHLNNLERQNIGEYSCSSKNEIGENHSTTLTLRVQCE